MSRPGVKDWKEEGAHPCQLSQHRPSGGTREGTCSGGGGGGLW